MADCVKLLAKSLISNYFINKELRRHKTLGKEKWPIRRKTGSVKTVISRTDPTISGKRAR